MTKHELVGLALEQLLETFESSPESFTYEDKDHSSTMVVTVPTIMWQPKFELNDKVVADPNNESKAIVIIMNDITDDISCYIFANSKYLTLSNASGMIPDAVIVSQQSFFSLRSNYRKFMKLKKLIIARDKAKENDKFLRKLCSVFPTTLDKHILK